MAGLRAQRQHQLFQVALVLLRQFPVGARSQQRKVLQVGDDAARKFFRGGDHVRQPRIDGAARHAVERGSGWRLHEHCAGLLLDRTQPQRAVRAHAGQDHADAVLLLVGRQGTEEVVDGQVQAARRRRFEQVQDAMEDRQVAVGRDDIDVIRLDGHPVLDSHHRHRGDALQQLRQGALVGGVEMLDDDEGQTAGRWHLPEKQLQRLQSAGGSADADNREGRARRCRLFLVAGGRLLRNLLPCYHGLPFDGFAMGVNVVRRTTRDNEANGASTIRR